MVDLIILYRLITTMYFQNIYLRLRAINATMLRNREKKYFDLIISDHPHPPPLRLLNALENHITSLVLQPAYLPLILQIELCSRWLFVSLKKKSHFLVKLLFGCRATTSSWLRMSKWEHCKESNMEGILSSRRKKQWGVSGYSQLNMRLREI